MPFINGRFYMNPAYGRALERARADEEPSRHNDSDRQESDGHWVTIDGHHVLIKESVSQRDSNSGAQTRSSGGQHHHVRKPLPPSGHASIYADSFEGKKTANGEIFNQNKYTAALLPRARWHAVPLGTRVEVEHGGTSVVVEINDRGAGDNNPESTRVLDLSRAAASALTGKDINDDDDAKKVGIIRLDKIKLVPADTPLGPMQR